MANKLPVGGCTDETTWSAYMDIRKMCPDIMSVCLSTPTDGGPTTGVPAGEPTTAVPAEEPMTTQETPLTTAGEIRLYPIYIFRW